MASVVKLLPRINTQRIANMQGTIASSSTVTNTIPTGGSIYGIYLRVRKGAGVASIAEIAADILRVQLRLDGEPILDASAAQIQALVNYLAGDIKGGAVTNGILPLYFAQAQMRGWEKGAALFRIGTANIAQITLDITFGAAALATTGIEVHVDRTDEVMPLGSHIRFLPYPQSFAGTGAYEISTLPKVPNSALLDLHTFAANISEVTVKLNNVPVHDQVSAELNNNLLERAGFTPQTNVYTVSQNRSRQSNDFLLFDGITDYRLVPTFTVAPNNFTVMQRTIHSVA
jgi:hypothetical protein